MMETTIKLRKLTAAEGYILTNGEAYGKVIYLGTNDSPANWQEIAQAEYAAILAAQERKEEEERKNV